MNRVRVGILGTGTIVRDYHLPVLLANPLAEVVALGNRHPDSLRALAARSDIRKTYTDFDRMADDPDFDAAVVALPNSLHAPVTITMLRAGKHVFCEKPAAMTAGEARDVAQTAGIAGRKLLFGHVWRYSPQVHWLREMIDSGKLGTISRVVGHAIVAAGKGTGGPGPGTWFVRPELSGGGALADVGIHSIDTLSFLFHDCLRPATVTASVGNRYRQLDVEDTASVRLEYHGGLIAQIEAGWYHDRAASPHGAVEVFGSEGEARTLPARGRYRSGGDWTELDFSSSLTHPDDDRPLYAAQMDHFLESILHDLPTACDGEQGVRDMIVLDAAYRSARSGSKVVVEDWPSRQPRGGDQPG